MKCPNCVDIDLAEAVNFTKVDINSCHECGGMWFDQDKLRQAKDAEVAYANWFDIDLWQNPENFSGVLSGKKCPKDEVEMHTITYSNSTIQIDVCSTCHGIWLDKGEFDLIVEYVKKEAGNEILHNYFSHLAEQTKEVFTGPEGFRSEISDVLMLVDMFKYKFAVQNPTLTQVLVNFPVK